MTDRPLAKAALKVIDAALEYRRAEQLFDASEYVTDDEQGFLDIAASELDNALIEWRNTVRRLRGKEPING